MKAWQELLKVLRGILAKYELLLKLSDAKHSRLIGLDAKGLEPLIKEEKKLTDGVEALEKRRQEVLKSLSEADKRLKPRMKLAEMYAFAPVTLRSDLREAHKALEKTLAALGEKTANNRLLIEGALRAVNMRLDKLGSGGGAEAAYGQKGVNHSPKRAGLEVRA